MEIIAAAPACTSDTQWEETADSLLLSSPDHFQAQLRQVKERLLSCSIETPCEIPACPKCADRLRKIWRNRLHKHISAAVFSRAQHLLFVTFTSAQWTSSRYRVCPEVVHFASQFSESQSEANYINGGWLAVEVHPTKYADVPDRRQMHWHIHGIIATDKPDKVAKALDTLCVANHARVHIDQKLGPADTASRSNWKTSEDLYQIIRYCDKSMTEKVGNAVDSLCIQATMSSTTTQFAFGDLSSAVSDEVAIRRLTAFRKDFRELSFALDKPENYAVVDDCLSAMTRLLADKITDNRDTIEASVEYLVEWSAELETQVLAGVESLIESAVRREFSLRNSRKYSGLAMHIAAGAEILRIRRTMDNRSWKKLEQLNQFWPAIRKYERRTKPANDVWLVEFCHSIYEDQIGLLLPTSGS